MSEDESTKPDNFFGSGIIKGFVIVANLVGIVVFAVMYFLGWFTTVESASYRATYAVWTYLPMLIPHIAVVIPGLFMIRDRAAGAIMGAVVVVMYLIAVVSDSFITVMYWIIWWNCIVRSGHGSLTGVNLAICTDDQNMLTVIWVLVNVLAFSAVIGFIAHVMFYYRTAMQSSWFKEAVDKAKTKRRKRGNYEEINPAPQMDPGADAGVTSLGKYRRTNRKWTNSIPSLSNLGQAPINGMRRMSTLI